MPCTRTRKWCNHFPSCLTIWYFYCYLCFSGICDQDIFFFSGAPSGHSHSHNHHSVSRRCHHEHRSQYCQKKSCGVHVKFNLSKEEKVDQLLVPVGLTHSFVSELWITSSSFSFLSSSVMVSTEITFYISFSLQLHPLRGTNKGSRNGKCFLVSENNAFPPGRHET